MQILPFEICSWEGGGAAGGGGGGAVWQLKFARAGEGVQW